MDVTWSRDEILVGISLVTCCVRIMISAFTLLRVQSIILDGMYLWILFRGFSWAKLHEGCGIEFDETGEEVWVFLRTWEKQVFQTVCWATLDLNGDDSHHGVTGLGRTLDTFGLDVSVVALTGGSNVLAEAFSSFLGNGHRQKLIDYSGFNLRLLKQCLQRTASSVSGSLDALSMTEFIVNRLKGAETRHWMASRPALRKAVLTNVLTMLHLLELVANIIGVWPLIV